MTELNVDQLSSEELKEQARILGISLKGGLNDETIRNKIKEALGEPTTPATPVTPNKAGSAKKQKTVVVNFPMTKEDKQPVFIGLNGKNYRVRRGEDVEIPAELLNVLEDAKQHICDEDGNWEWVPTYNYNVVSR